MDDRRPLVVIEGGRRSASAPLDDAIARARLGDWHIVRGWAAPMRRERVVCTGWIRSPDDARRALLAAVSGAGLVVGVAAGRDTLDRFLDDLRRLGPVEHVTVAERESRSLTADERALIGLLAEGLTVREAAAELGIGRRTADRRLAAARRAGASSPAAIAAALARRD